LEKRGIVTLNKKKKEREGELFVTFVDRNMEIK
jgi:hypothetical protein